MWLYRGETGKYQALLDEYERAITTEIARDDELLAAVYPNCGFPRIPDLQSFTKARRDKAKAEVDAALRKESPGCME